MRGHVLRKLQLCALQPIRVIYDFLAQFERGALAQVLKAAVSGRPVLTCDVGSGPMLGDDVLRCLQPLP